MGWEEEGNFEGVTYDWEKFEEFQGKYWTQISPSGMIKCNLHNTIFNPEEEPCWQCYELTRQFLC
jgi:hypothetical protein